MTANDLFETALQFTLKWEGGFVDDPADPGGETNYGITEKVARQHGYKGSMRALPIEVAEDIYRMDYWDAVKLDDVAEDRPLFAIAIFDAAVNLGPLQARKLAQKSAGTTADGIWGPLTRKAFRDRSDTVLVEMMCFYRRQYYKDLAGRKPAMQKFLKGWLRRVDDLQQYVRMVEA